MNSAGSFVIGADHPALPGHFPGHPIVPGVVLLDHAVLRIGAALGAHDGLRLRGIASAKFLAPVAPGQCVDVRYEHDAGHAIRFLLETGGRAVASGTLTTGEWTA